MTGRNNRILAALPLFAAFLAAPAAVLSGRLAGRPEIIGNLGPQGLGLWLGLAGLAALLGIGGAFRRDAPLPEPERGRARRIRRRIPAFLLLAAATYAALRFLGPALAREADLAAFVGEWRLPALLAFAVLWVRSFGTTGRAMFARLGACLGALTLADFVLTAIAEHRIILGGGLLFGTADGTTDSLAFLLCLAYCATLSPQGEGAERIPGLPALRLLILAGLLATFSRAGLAAAAIVCLSHDGAPPHERACIVLACLIGIWMSVVMPLPRIPGLGDGLGLSWYWAATIEAMHRQPLALLFGLPLDAPMALALPEIGAGTMIPELDGLPVSVFQIPVSILRLAATWGIWAPLLLFLAAGWCAWRGRSRFGLGTFTALLVGALLGPVLYTPTTLVAAALALLTAAGAPRCGTEREPGRQNGNPPGDARQPHNEPTFQ